MGMAASQVRFMQLTSRKNDIGRQLQSCSLQKMSLSRDMRRVSAEYQEALNSKVLKWSRNAGATYSDLSYDSLMRPGVQNNNIPYLLTDKDGKVVLDSKFLKYAEMLSPNGTPGGDWESNRTQILSQLTGIPAESIENYKSTNAAVESTANTVNNAQEKTDKLHSNCTKNVNSGDFIKTCFGSVQNLSSNASQTSSNVYNDYKDATLDPDVDWILGGTKSASQTILKQVLNQICNNAKNYLHDSDYEALLEAADATYAIYSNHLSTAETGDAKKNTEADLPVYRENVYYHIDIVDFIDCLMNQYEKAGASTHASSNCNTTLYETTDRSTQAYTDYKTSESELAGAKNNYKSAVDTNNIVFGATQEAQLAFYDQLFQAIVDKGWTCNSQVQDTDYLNQMLQNNQYFISTMSPTIDNEGKNIFEYEATPAASMDFIYPVNDTDLQNQALAEYEHEKSIINEKESRIDTRMQDLQTEQSAITEMLKGIESVRNDNIERTLSVMS